MNNALPSILKINIKIADDLKYANVAFLVDREDFLRDIQEIRANMGINGLIPYEGIKEWKHRGTKEGSLTTMDAEGKEALKRWADLTTAINTLKQKYHRGVHFTRVIECAILAGEIREDDYKRSAYCESYPFSYEFNEQGLEIEEPMVAIFVNQETQIDEVTKLFNNDVKELLKNISAGKQKYPRKSENIKRDREWYWKHKDGISYQKILNQTPDACVERQAVIDAIKQYKMNIGVRK